MKTNKTFLFHVVLLLIVCISTGGQLASANNTTITDKPTDKTTVSSTEITTLKSTTVESTTEAKTTGTSIVTTESTTDTPTQAPTTTTPATTAPPATTTPAPEPVPKVSPGTWNVTDGNTTCIRVKMEALFIISHNGKLHYIALSPNASEADSSCETSNVTQTLVLTDQNYAFTMEFEKDAQQTYVKNMTFSYTIPEGKGFVYNDTKYFSVKTGNSYLCNSANNITLENVTLTVTELQIQAFGAQGNTGFANAEECDSDDIVNNIVPIAVGCALAALVIVVLIAYLVGRRRSRQKGYQSV